MGGDHLSCRADQAYVASMPGPLGPRPPWPCTRLAGQRRNIPEASAAYCCRGAPARSPPARRPSAPRSSRRGRGNGRRAGPMTAPALRRRRRGTGGRAARAPRRGRFLDREEVRWVGRGPHEEHVPAPAESGRRPWREGPHVHAVRHDRRLRGDPGISRSARSRSTQEQKLTWSAAAQHASSMAPSPARRTASKSSGDSG